MTGPKRRGGVGAVGLVGISDLLASRTRAGGSAFGAASRACCPPPPATPLSASSSASSGDAIRNAKGWSGRLPCRSNVCFLNFDGGSADPSRDPISDPTPAALPKAAKRTLSSLRRRLAAWQFSPSSW
jgi:hypothetical protein